MMKALRFDRTGSLDALSLQQVPPPRPQPGEVVVEICAAGVNPSDAKNVLGRFPYTTLPRTPGRDFAGVVVDGPAEMIGEEVWGTGKEFGFVRDGSHAERIAVPLDGIAPKPGLLTFAQAAGCGVPYTTAWDALERSGVGPGDGLLVIGAAGAVGRAALDLGRWRGAQVIGAVRRPQQVEQLAAEGFETILLGEGDDLSAAVRRYYPAGADVVFDTSGAWLGPSVAALADFGRIATIAAPPSGAAAAGPVPPRRQRRRRQLAALRQPRLRGDAGPLQRRLRHRLTAAAAGAAGTPARQRPRGLPRDRRRQHAEGGVHSWLMAHPSFPRQWG